MFEKEESAILRKVRRPQTQAQAQALAEVTAPNRLFDPATGYELTESENLLFPSQIGTPLEIGFKKDADDRIVPDHPSEVVGQALILNSLGIKDRALYAGVVFQISEIARRSERRVEGMNFVLGLARSVGPKDQLEAMLALQMAAVHFAGMHFLSEVRRAPTPEQQTTCERIATNLLRTFNSQVEVLRKRRNGGSQKVYVEHVHVHEGGQAVVGNVSRRSAL